MFLTKINIFFIQQYVHVKIFVKKPKLLSILLIKRKKWQEKLFKNSMKKLNIARKLPLGAVLKITVAYLYAKTYGRYEQLY